MNVFVVTTVAILMLLRDFGPCGIMLMKYKISRQKLREDIRQ
jgi:hypothetical protein